MDESQQPDASKLTVAVITVSDRSFAGDRADASGPAAREVLTAAGCTVIGDEIVPDSKKLIRQAMKRALDSGARAVLLTGGTGIAPGDRTVPSVRPLLTTKLSGIGEELRRRGVAAGAPGALLSRAFGGLIGEGADAAFVIAAPGSVGGARDAAQLLVELGDHILSQLSGGDHDGR